ncbi:sugar ABC transporter substrate-binding protein [Desemzia incerta]|uniref:sugar ABC transporter substrate-binding protein n=1 Tax=Desemzia incerta TaxID=82801 RepID=UPI003314A076
MNKKKMLGLLSGVALSMVLAACGPGESGSEATEDTKQSNGEGSTTLVVWEDIDKAKGIEDAVAEFEEIHNVTVEVIEKPYANQIEDLRLDGPGGTGPDVLTMPGDQIGTSVTEGLLYELQVDEEIQNMYSEASMQSQMVDGKVYGLPKAVETTMLYYNKDIVSEEDLPETLDEWYELSKELTDGENFGFLALWDQIYYANSVMSGYGGYIFGQDGEGKYDVTDIGLNNEGAVEAAEVMQRFYEDNLFPSGIIGEQGINVLDSLFTEGKAAAVISGPWNLDPFSSAGVDYGVTTLPTLPNGEPMSSFIGVKSYNVSSYSKNPELAQEFVEFIANEENSRTRFELTQEVPAVTALADDSVIMENEAAQAVAKQSQVSVLTPNVPEMNEVWLPADAALQTIATGQAEPKAALDEATQAIENQIEANHGGQ